MDRFCFFFILLSFATVTSYSQNPIVLVNADSIVGYQLKQKPVRDFVGNVHLRQGNVDLFCNRATHFIDENRAFLFGSVKIVQDTLVLLSDNIEYDGNKSVANASGRLIISDPLSSLSASSGSYSFKSKVANFLGGVVYKEKNSKLIADRIDYYRQLQIIYSFGNVTFETDSLLLKCDTLTFYRDQDKIFGSGNVILSARFEPVIMNSSYLSIDRREKITKGFGGPILIVLDTIKTDIDTIGFRLDSLIIFADTLITKQNNGNSELVFKQNIRLFKGKLTAISGYGKILRDEEIGYLVQKPFLWYDSTEFRGDSVFFVLKNQKISFVKLIGNSCVFTPSYIDTAYIQKILADTLDLYFRENQINFLLGFGNAKTSYFLKNEETNEVQLANYLSDSIRINFIDNEVFDVLWFSNVSGEVIPKVMFQKDLRKYYEFPKNYLIFKPRKVINYK